MGDAASSDRPGGLLRRHRLAVGLTQEALAERSGVAKRTIQDLERGVALPRRETLRRLLDALSPAPDARAALEAVRPSRQPRRARPMPRERRANHAVEEVTARCQFTIPIPRTRLIGRTQELMAVRRLLLGEDVGLVTLTGPAGIGKTRLGLQVAADLVDVFPDGICFVALAPINDPDLVPATIAQALEIRDLGRRPVLESLKDFLRERRLLLLLDNFEQIVAAAPVVGELLGISRGLTVLATSRAPLGLRGEHEWPVPPLALPNRLDSRSAESLSQVAAVALFVERAAAIKADVAWTDESVRDVAEICRRLDGLPLAIELAAARVRVLTPRLLLGRLERRLPLLTGGAHDLPAHQQTLRGSIAWSHDLLDADERRLFRRLAVFVGGCTLDAAEHVASERPTDARDEASSARVARGSQPSALDLVGSLVAQNLVRQHDEPDGDVRLDMLQTIREFASEQLEASGEMPALRDRHLAAYLAFAETARAELQGPRQAAWFDRLEREVGNLQAALEWSSSDHDASPGIVDGASRVEAGSRLAAALGFFWILRGRGRENLPRVKALVERAAPGTAAQARILTVAAQVLGPMLGDYTAALPFAAEGLSAWLRLGDRHGIAVALLRRAQVAFGLGDFQHALALLAESRALFCELGGESGAEWPLVLLIADVTQASGDLDRAERLYEEALVEARAQADGHAIQHASRNWGRIRWLRGDPAGALAMLRESVALLLPLKDVRCAYVCLEDFAAMLCEHDTPAPVTRLFGAAEATRELIGTPMAGAQLTYHERGVAIVKRRLTAQQFAAAWAEGRGMTVEQALTYALARPIPP